jgi:hypothetical protein
VRAVQDNTPKNTPLVAGLTDCADYNVQSLDVLQLDLENIGGAALTGFKVLSKVSGSSPWRDITPASMTTESARVFNPASAAPATLAAGAWTYLGLNVTDLHSIKIQASGAAATLRISAGGYEVAS